MTLLLPLTFNLISFVLTNRYSVKNILKMCLIFCPVNDSIIVNPKLIQIHQTFPLYAGGLKITLNNTTFYWYIQTAIHMSKIENHFKT